MVSPHKYAITSIAYANGTLERVRDLEYQSISGSRSDLGLSGHRTPRGMLRSGGSERDYDMMDDTRTEIIIENTSGSRRGSVGGRRKYYNY